jgi:outer membrane lipoprotein-sorting protein
MSVFTSRPVLRWVVPVAAAVAVIGGGAAARTLSAQAEPSLPERSAAQLLVDLQTARLDGMSGTVVLRSDLGLPALPAGLGQGSADLTSLLSGKHTLRVWYSGPDKTRIALLGTNGETDVIRNGRDVWYWDSRTKSARHGTLAPEEATAPTPDTVPHSPQQAADMALRLISPSTEVTTGSNARVAGRAAYELVLAPRDKASLLGEIRLAIDATEHVPLRVQVYPKGAKSEADAAFEVKFTDISFSRPDAGQFTFNPPPGVTVTEEGQSEPGKSPADKPADRPADKEDADAKRAVIGSGWTSVIVTRVGDAAPDPSKSDPNKDPNKAGDADNEGAQAITGILNGLPKVSGTWGSGRVMSSKLFSVLLTDDGRVLIGAVTPERLAEVAGDPAAALK